MYGMLLARNRRTIKLRLNEKLNVQHRAIDRIVHRYRRLGAALLDPDISDVELRTKLLETVPATDLREDQTDLENWTPGDNKVRFVATAERHGSLSRLVAPFLERMKFVDEKATAASPTLAAVRAYREYRAAWRRSLPRAAPLEFASKSIKPLLCRHGVIDRRRWESALFHKVRDEIRAGNLAIGGAKNFGRFEAFFLPNAQWEQVCETFWKRTGFPDDPGLAVNYLKARLSEAFDHFPEGVPENRQVTFDDKGWRLRKDPAVHLDPARSQFLAELADESDCRQDPSGGRKQLGRPLVPVCLGS